MSAPQAPKPEDVLRELRKMPLEDQVAKLEEYLLGGGLSKEIQASFSAYDQKRRAESAVLPGANPAQKQDWFALVKEGLETFKGSGGGGGGIITVRIDDITQRAIERNIQRALSNAFNLTIGANHELVA